MNLIIGHHVRITDGLKSIIDQIKHTESNVFQVFLKSPQAFNSPRKNKEDLIYVRNYTKNNNIKIVIHASYLLNFCNNSDTSIYKNAIKSLVNDLLDGEILESIGVVVHMGKKCKLEEETAFKNYIKGIKECLKITKELGCNQKIIFETGASQGTEICSSIEGLKKIWDEFIDEDKKRLGFCIDTCHIFASGYDIRDIKNINKFYKKFNNLIGWEYVECIHFNDSKKGLGCCVDRHADIGKGDIGSHGLKLFAKMCVKTNKPIILETPCNYYTDDWTIVENKNINKELHYQFTYKDQVDKIKKWINKWDTKINNKNNLHIF